MKIPREWFKKNFLRDQFKRYLPYLGFSLVFILSLVALFNPYYFDDFIIIRDNAWLYEFNPFRWFHSFYLDSYQLFPGYRPFLMVSFWLNQLFFGSHIAIFRLGNILIHVFNGVLAYRLLRRILSQHFSREIILGMVLLFLLHPVQSLAINFIWKRSTLLETFFILLGLNLHLELVSRGQSLKRILVTHLTLFVLMLGIKESGILYPLWIYAFHMFFLPGKNQPIKLYVVMGIVATLFYGFRVIYMNNQLTAMRTTIPDWRSVGSMDYLLWSVNEVPKMILGMVFPNPLIISDPLFEPASVPLAFLIFIPSVLLLLVTLKSRFYHKPHIVFAVLLIILSFVPSNTIVPLYFVSDQIRLYLPILGFSILLGSLLSSRVVSRVIPSSVMIVGFVFLYAIQFVSQNRRYHYPQLIWQDVVYSYPESGLAWGELGGVLQAQKRFGEAGLAFFLAAKYEKTKPGYTIRAIDNMIKSNTSDGVIEDLLDDLTLEHLGVADVVNLATVYVQLDDFQRAENLLFYAIEVNPDFSPAYQRLGILYEIMGQPEKAKTFYEKAIERNPSDETSKQRL
ncbi:MAG: tetratricopeptide repeat protein [Bdellovibrionales bacterium]|nr:tetratricopeptide repeat protein [Bdellovibrionales bacterium]